MKTNLADIRNEYKQRSLSKKDVDNNPINQFNAWFNEALEAEISEINAMFLATIRSDNRPTGRIVLLKGLSNGNFQFYTNYNSEKGKELNYRPYASLTFFWKELERQIRIEGSVEKVSEEESNLYFNSRPKESQIGAWASSQSHVIENRQALEDSYQKYTNKFKDIKVPRPKHWGGYQLIPETIEFWQGRPGRLHDRILYELNENGIWTTKRLAP